IPLLFQAFEGRLFGNSSNHCGQRVVAAESLPVSDKSPGVAGGREGGRRVPSRLTSYRGTKVGGPPGPFPLHFVQGTKSGGRGRGLGLTELSARRRWARARVQLAGPEASHQLRPRQQLLEGAPIDDPPAVHEQDL